MFWCVYEEYKGLLASHHALWDAFGWIKNVPHSLSRPHVELVNIASATHTQIPKKGDSNSCCNCAMNNALHAQCRNCGFMLLFLAASCLFIHFHFPPSPNYYIQLRITNLPLYIPQLHYLLPSSSRVQWKEAPRLIPVFILTLLCNTIHKQKINK